MQQGALKNVSSHLLGGLNEREHSRDKFVIAELSHFEVNTKH